MIDHMELWKIIYSQELPGILEALDKKFVLLKKEENL